MSATIFKSTNSSAFSVNLTWLTSASRHFHRMLQLLSRLPSF